MWYTFRKSNERTDRRCVYYLLKMKNPWPEPLGRSLKKIIIPLILYIMDGITVLKKLRNLGISTPVLLLTAKSEVEDKVNGLDSGANDYLTKPFATQELLARIRAMTRTNTAQSSSRMHMGNITLDRATFEMSTPFGSFRLANREFQMMETLISNPGHVIPSERFLEKICGSNLSLSLCFHCSLSLLSSWVQCILLIIKIW